MAATDDHVGWLRCVSPCGARAESRSSKYLNNLIEQDHRSVKQCIAVMLGFKQFHHAAITIAGVELMHRIHKRQFGLRRLGLQGRAAPAVWNAVLGAWRWRAASGTLMRVPPICTGTGAGTLDSLPHNGAVVTLLAVCGSTHTKSYVDIVMVAIVGALVALIAVISLGGLIGSF